MEVKSAGSNLRPSTPRHMRSTYCLSSSSLHKAHTRPHSIPGRLFAHVSKQPQLLSTSSSSNSRQPCTVGSRGQQQRSTVVPCAASSSDSSSSTGDSWTWKSPDWRVLQRKGRAAGAIVSSCASFYSVSSRTMAPHVARVINCEPESYDPGSCEQGN